MHVGKGEFLLSAIRSLLAYLSLRGNDPGPLFLFCDGRPLSHAILSSWLRDILASVGIPGKFSSHSFCIGAAMVAARNGISDHQIQASGHWTSTTYLSYICIPVDWSRLLLLDDRLFRPHRTCSDGGVPATGLVCICAVFGAWVLVLGRFGGP